MTTRLALKVGRLGGLLALFLAVAWFFWPTALGGATTFVATHGTSMQPRFSSGDMAVLRPAETYGVGDVIAFHSDELNTTVMHRIVAREGDRFVTQGDNNSWTDPGGPSAGEVLGRLWFRIPEGGDVVAVFRTPALLALAALAGATVLWRLRAARGRPDRTETRARLPAVAIPVRARARQVAAVSGAVALLCAAGGAALYVVPGTDVETQTVQLTQRGTYGYSGTAVPGVTYPTGRISTGDPIYTELLRTLAVQLDIDITGPGLDSLRGRARLDVSVAARDGWTAPLGSGPLASVVEPGTLSASVALDLHAAAELLTRHSEEIGTPAAGATVVVTPVMKFDGTLHGKSFAVATPPAPLRLDLDATALRLAGDPADALESSTSTDVTFDQVTDHHMTVFGASVPVGLARTVVFVLLVVTALVAAASAWLGWPRSGNTVDEFLLRHAGRIVEVNSFTLGATVIDVTEPEALHRVAERLDSLVMHHVGPYGHLFAVQDADTTYCHMVS